MGLAWWLVGIVAFMTIVGILPTKSDDRGNLMRSTVARIKTALVLIVLMAVSVVPIPVTSTIGLLIVIFRPNWFKRLVDAIYSDKM